MVEELKNKIQSELDNYKVLQKEYSKNLSVRETLDGQLRENQTVKEELDLLKADGEVYKLHGPVLIKMDLEESKQNVAKRMDYISKELKRIEGILVGLDENQEKHRNAIQKLQQQFQQMQVKAAMQM